MHKVNNVGKIFLFSAPSGAGKTTIVNVILQELQKSYVIQKVITYTTRSIRKGEVDGIDYFFITKEEFEAKIQEGFFLEWSNWYENYYGSPRSSVDDLQKGISCIMIVDRFGARAIKSIYPQVVLIWLEPVDLEVLKERLLLRGTDTQEEIQKRLIKASLEMDEEKEEKLYTYHIINDDFYETIEKCINCIVVEILKK